MVVGFLTLEIHFPYSHCLKDKRKVLNRLKDRIRQKYNAAFAELDYQNKWQRTKIGIVTLNSKKSVVEQLIQRVIAEAEENIDGEIVAYQIHYL